MSYGRAAAAIRLVLASADRALTCAEVLARGGAALRSTTQVASLLNLEVRNGLAVREGTRGEYRYEPTAAGREAADHPERTRRRTPRRRSRARRSPHTSILIEAITHAR